MKAVLLKGDKEVEVVDRGQPEPGPGEVVVKTRVSAVCRSDMTLYYGDPIVGGEDAGKGLVIPGHEPAGEVSEIGPGVEHLREGDRVAAYLALGCGFCRHCRAGDLMLCDRWQCLGFDVDGGDAEYFKVPAQNALRLDDDISFTAGALCTDMLGTQYYAQKRLTVSGADTVLVVGLGPMGAAAVMVAQAHGARVVAADLIDDRLTLASELGAHHLVNPGDGNALDQIMETTQDRGVEVALDCSGAPQGQNLALDAVAKNGRVAFVGESRSTEINPSDQFIRKVIHAIGAWYFPIWAFDEIQRFVIEHQLPVEQLVTHEFSLDDAEEAFRMFDERETEKAVFVFE